MMKRLATTTAALMLLVTPVNAATIEGDSLSVGAAPYTACVTHAKVGRSSNAVTPYTGALITLGANGPASATKLRAAAKTGARWATIWLPGRPTQTAAFNARLRRYGLGHPDWAAYARTLPRSAWAGDGVHMTPTGYRLRGRWFSRYC